MDVVNQSGTLFYLEVRGLRRAHDLRQRWSRELTQREVGRGTLLELGEPYVLFFGNRVWGTFDIARSSSRISLFEESAHFRSKPRSK
jgi:hypothetical protein